MKKQIIIATLTALGATQLTPAQAATAEPDNTNTSVEETVGLGSGVVIGAMAGGPVGAVIGAGLGAWLGNRMDRAQHVALERDALDAALVDARNDLSASQGLVSALRRDIVSLESAVEDRDIRIASLEQMPDDRALYRALGTGVEVDVLFRTGESDLAVETGSRLAGLASTLASIPGLDVRLDGYSDPRGDETYNRTLSEMRVSSVERVLRAAGLDKERIRRYAHGETHSDAGQGDLDGFAMERRVSITFIDAAAVADTDVPDEGERLSQASMELDPAL